MTGVRDRPRPLQLARSTQLGKQQLMQTLPHPRPLPLIEAAVTGRTRAKAELGRKMAPGDPRMQHEQNPLQRLPIRKTLATRKAVPPLQLRQKRLDPLPKRVRHDPRRDSHRHPSQLDDGCRRPSSSGNGSLHFDSSSKTLVAGAGAAAIAAAPARAASEQGAVGSWFLTILATDPPVGSFNGLISFHVGGVVTEARRCYVKPTPLGDLLETSGHGAWKPKGGRIYEAFFRFVLQQAPPSDGLPIGTDNVRLTFELDSAGEKLTGSFESDLRDNAGAVLATVKGTVLGERISA